MRTIHCFDCDSDDPDLWNQTLEAADLQQAVEKAEKQDTRGARQAQTASQCGKKRRVDPTVRV